MRGAEIEGADVPRSGKHVRQRGAEGGSAGVAGLQFIETAREITGESGFVDAKLLEDARKVAISDVEELEKEMLELDVIVSAGQAKAGSSFESIPSRIIEFPDQTFQICRHDDLASLNIENGFFRMTIHGL